jgi:hypothetical protein
VNKYPTANFASTFVAQLFESEHQPAAHIWLEMPEFLVKMRRLGISGLNGRAGGKVHKKSSYSQDTEGGSVETRWFFDMPRHSTETASRKNEKLIDS